ncbi:hypothetical protein [Algibacter sp. L3A6]|uniref:hypothetical protein n=1 Tax=Algibacter sp. L3A6 TaxID=2686366 RepID=UPI00131E3226|nr:hypothetical protein [Algibacter sp. L3A6]
MEYHKVYNHFYNKTFTATKRIIISKFKKAKAKKRPFHTTSNGMLRSLSTCRIEKFENVLKDRAADAYHIFKKRYEYVDGEPKEVIKQILEEEVLEAFVSSQGYTFTKFIADIAIADCLDEIRRHYSNYISYYQVIYEQDKYGYFYLKDFQGGGYESSSEYNEMLDVKYPYRIDERKEAERVEKSKRKGGKPALSIKDKNELSIEEIDAVDIINSFSDGERALLFAIFHDENKKNNLTEIPLTELIRFTKITGSYEDLSIFKKNVKNSTFYSMANKGISYYTATQGQKELIEDTKAKLQKLKVPFMVRLLSKLLLELR